MQGNDEASEGRRREDVTPGRAPSRWAFIYAYVRANPFEFGLGGAAAIGGLYAFYEPMAVHQSAVAVQSLTLAWAWTITYTIAGLLIVIGMLGSTRSWGWRLELAGLSILLTGLLGNATAILAARGSQGAIVSATYIVLSGSCVVRSKVILELMRAGTIGRRRDR
jgi:hypothetical protein